MDNILSICKSNSYYALVDTANTVKAFLFHAMADVFDNDTMRVQKSALR